MEKDREICHESFGMARFVRRNGNPGFMYGSDVVPEKYVVLEISKNSTLEYDRTMGRLCGASSKRSDEVVCIQMTSAQFAELITTINIGDGVPCTIQRINGEWIEQFKDGVQCRVDYEAEKLRNSLKNLRPKFRETSERIKGIIQKLSKVKQNEVLRELTNLQNEICANAPFYLDMFTKACEETTATAKTEIASYLSLVSASDEIRKSIGGIQTKGMLGNFNDNSEEI